MADQHPPWTVKGASPELREAFNKFLKQTQRDGSYSRIVKKYYPTAYAFFPDFFKGR